MAAKLRAGLLVVTFVGATLTAFLGDRGYLDVQRSQRELEALQAEVAAQRQRVRELDRRARRLQSEPEAVERIAREELNRVLPGETLFLLPKEAGPPRFAGGESRVP
ncbi:hypothetical protein ABI59_02375 [Acidobacteria bacterium Mor1]|nr:hypothetical protein ABI59_02375 [Acidobacteria bacterium Mor1]